MTISEMMLPEFDQEMASTRKVLEVVPGDCLGWKPHEKSMTLGRLASHVAEMTMWAEYALVLDRLVLTPGQKSANVASVEELIPLFEAALPAARAALAAATDEHFMKKWDLEVMGRVVMSRPRVEIFRGVVMNHMVHHRAQLGVYLRLKNVAIPGMYGPSADEGRMF